ncbi:hypothetical protein [Streptomyces palmae]|uniref:hypothetical protein n=1 Tax=Streptomyces palmae TaxID=1701085 RepID=UPI0036DE8E16
MELHDAPGFPEPPRYFPGHLGVSTGPSVDPDAYQRLVLEETHGSVDMDSPVEVDEFRFDRSSGLLRLMNLRVPEYRAQDRRRALDWLSVESRPGTLRLVEPKARFHVDPATTLCYSGSELILLRDRPDGPAADRLRVQVAPGLHLLFGDGLLAGWMMDAPESRICPDSGTPSPYPADPVLAEILAEYYELLTFPALDGLMDEEPEFRQALEALAERIEVHAGAVDRRSVLREHIQELVREWFEE